MRWCRAPKKMTMRTFLKIGQHISESSIIKHWSTSNSTFMDGCQRAFNASYNACWHLILNLPSAHNDLECVGILRVFKVMRVIQCKVDRPQITHCVCRYIEIQICRLLLFQERGRRLSNTPRDSKQIIRHSTPEAPEHKRAQKQYSKPKQHYTTEENDWAENTEQKHQNSKVQNTESTLLIKQTRSSGSIL